MIGIIGVGKALEQGVVPPGTTAVLPRGAALPCNADRLLLLLDGKDLLQRDVMDPIVAEVVGVGHLLRADLGQGHLIFIEQFAVIPAEVTFNVISRHDAHPLAELELM